MTDGGFQDLAQRDDLIVNGAARRGFVLGRGLDAVDAVFLDLAGGDLRKAGRAEERDQVQAEPRLVAFDPTRASLPLGDDLVFALEDACGLLEGLLADQLAAAVLITQR